MAEPNSTRARRPAVNHRVPSAFRAPPAMRACGPTCCQVYNYMASGVLLTGIVAMLFAPYARDALFNQAERA